MYENDKYIWNNHSAHMNILDIVLNIKHGT